MSTFEIQIDGKTIQAEEGKSILEVCHKESISIPTLCYHSDLNVAGICRICVVEIEGWKTLQAACATPVSPGMEIRTYSDKVRRARRTILELMLSNHYGYCWTCARNQNCELQKLAAEYGIDKPLRFEPVKEPRWEIEDSSPSVVRDKNKCILCKRCIRTCIDLQQVGVIEARGRGHDTDVVTLFDKPLAHVNCIYCGQCINRCPTGALKANDPADEVWKAIDDPNKFVVAHPAPSIRVSIGECFGMEPGHRVTGKLVTALKKAGFDSVLDTNFTADLTIIEEGTEFLHRVTAAVKDKDPNVKLPMVTSCSPGWIKYCEHFYPDLLGHLSTCKSPQQMFGAVAKTYFAKKMNIDPKNMVTVAIMPCSAKKFEANRPEMNDSGFKDVDYGLTTRETALMIKESGIDFLKLEETEFDRFMGESSGAADIFGATGGVMEAALRTVYFLITGRNVPFENLQIFPVRGMEGVKEASIKLENLKKEYSFLEGVEVKIAVAHGTANAKKVMDLVRSGEAGYHFIEIMGCPGGCIGGGGQPIPTSLEIRKKRAAAIYEEDADKKLRMSHENPEIDMIYKEFLGQPCGEVSHHLLHTHYTPRARYLEK